MRNNFRGDKNEFLVLLENVKGRDYFGISGIKGMIILK
jgi:hypothetical protein